MEAKSFLSVEECRNVIDAIAEAEKNCSGEIRVNIANKAGENVMESAVNVFYSLEMDKTLRKNGVLFFIASEDRRFAVIGDEGTKSASGKASPFNGLKKTTFPNRLSWAMFSRYIKLKAASLATAMVMFP